MKSIIHFFSSVKLAIILLIIITLASIVGTLIPQQGSEAEYAVRYGQFSKVLIELEFTRLYHSRWFICLLILFSLNIIICTLTRFSPKIKRTLNPKLEKETKKIQALKICESFKKNWGLIKTKDEIKELLTSRHYRIKEEVKENRGFLLARKKAIGPFGVDIVHLGLLVILFGGIISGLGGFRNNFTLSEGQTLPVPKASFKLRLEKFEIEYYQNKTIKDWKSTLTVIENGSELLTKKIEVNHPLSYKGFVFYQSSYGWDWKNPLLEIWARKKDDPSFLHKIKLELGEKMRLPGSNIVLSARHFLPDFILNENNEATSRSLQPNNPAAFIEGWEDNEKIFYGWIFAKFPDFSRIHSSSETNLSLELKDFSSRHYSGIQMAKDPGVNLVWIGCAILMVGLFIAFYWPLREIKFILEESQGKTNVFAGGLASKSRDAFHSEFETIMISLRRSK